MMFQVGDRVRFTGPVGLLSATVAKANKRFAFLDNGLRCGQKTGKIVGQTAWVHAAKSEQP